MLNFKVAKKHKLKEQKAHVEVAESGDYKKQSRGSNLVCPHGAPGFNLFM